jgi:2-oxoglutarate dehydrogenase E1 component
VVLCSGKIAIDLLAHESRVHNEELAIVRIEMLYPFPDERIKQILARYPRASEVIWVQEEPCNMGAWNYLSPQLAKIVDRGVTVEVISRPNRASPAAGFSDLNIAEQEQILANTFSLPLKQPGESYVR